MVLLNHAGFNGILEILRTRATNGVTPEVEILQGLKRVLKKSIRLVQTIAGAKALDSSRHIRHD